MTSSPNKTVSNEIIEKLVAICNEIDSKLQLTRDDIQVSTFESGAVSEIFRVTFNNQAHFPICIKLYPSDQRAGFEVINSQLNNLVVGQSGLGPAILLIKKDSLVSTYLENSRELSFNEDDQDMTIREQIARKIARFHRIHSPIGSDRGEKYVRTFFETWISLKWFQSYDEGFLRDLMVKQNCTKLLEKNLRIEINEIKNRVLSIEDEKIVFSHNDLTHANTLIQDGKKITFIDFDYSGYFYRGADLSRYILECTNREMQCANLISDYEMRQIVGWYVDEAAKLENKTIDQSERESEIDYLLSQTKLLILFNYLFDVIFCLHMSKRSADDKAKSEQYMRNAEIMFCGYFQAKTRFQIDA